MKKYLTVFLVTLVSLTLLMIPGAVAESVNASPIGTGIDLTPIFQALIALLASIISHGLRPAQRPSSRKCFELRCPWRFMPQSSYTALVLAKIS